MGLGPCKVRVWFWDGVFGVRVGCWLDAEDGGWPVLHHSRRRQDVQPFENRAAAMKAVDTVLGVDREFGSWDVNRIEIVAF